jgi:hypothetical protein
MTTIRSKIISGLAIITCGTWASHLNALFGGKTELELNGIGVIKEAAEILAKSVETFPTKQMALAIIGFIMVSQGLYFFVKGLTYCICGNAYSPTGKRVGRLNGFVQCLISLAFIVCGSLAALYSSSITHYIFGR